MAITKEKKVEILEKLKDISTKASSVVFLNFHGLTVDEANEIRSDLKSKEVGYFVAKKTLAKKAFSESKVAGEMPEFPGELAIVWGEDDPVVPAGSVYSFQKKFDGSVSIVGGVFEGNYKDQAGMITIAQIPPKDVLRGMFVNIINSPIQRCAIALGEIAKQKQA